MISETMADIIFQRLLFFFNRATFSMKDQQSHLCFLLVVIFSFHSDSPKETILFYLPYRKTNCTTCSSLFLLGHRETKQRNIRISPFFTRTWHSRSFLLQSKALFFLLLLRLKHQDQLYPVVFLTHFFLLQAFAS